MIIILCIPLGVLCLVLACLCFGVNRRRHAVVCSLLGVFFLGVAALASYGTSVLIQSLPATT